MQNGTTSRLRKGDRVDTGFEYSFPAIRGIQAEREYYISMLPLRLLPRIFTLNADELPPELRAQRQISRGRIPEMARYLTENKDTYVFSAITVSIDGNVSFSSDGGNSDAQFTGILKIPMDAKFVINDGQHRRAAIERAIENEPNLRDETIAVVFYIDAGLKRCQQMFTDLNKFAIRPARSLSVLYDHRDDKSEVARQVVLQCDIFRDVVDLERSTLSKGSKKLFTLSAVYTATGTLLANINEEPDQRAEIARNYWSLLAPYFPQWSRVQKGDMYAREVRERYIHTHGVVLHALGRVGNALLHQGAPIKKSQLKPLKNMNWQRSNAASWEGRAINGGRVVKGNNNVILTANKIKSELNLPLSAEEQRVEDAFMRRENA